MAERKRQIQEKAYTPGHDRRHKAGSWVLILAHELGCAADIALNRPRSAGEFDRALEKIGAVAVAALDARIPE